MAYRLHDNRLFTAKTATIPCCLQVYEWHKNLRIAKVGSHLL